MREFSKLTRYTFKIPKSVIFLHINKEEKKVFLEVSFIVASKNIKNLEINLTKDMLSAVQEKL